MLRPYISVAPSKNREEVLTLPICGVGGVWSDEGAAFFRRSEVVVLELTRLSASTLYSLWQEGENRWMEERELVENGMEDDVAEQVALHLRMSLAAPVQAALQQQWELDVGDWCTDVWSRSEEDSLYDSIIRITRVDRKRQAVVGIEYKLAAAEEEEGRLVKCWEASEGAMRRPWVSGCFDRSGLRSLHQKCGHSFG